jgi:hypothetical protein
MLASATRSRRSALNCTLRLSRQTQTRAGVLGITERSSGAVNALAARAHRGQSACVSDGADSVRAYSRIVSRCRSRNETPTRASSGGHVLS